MDEKMFSLSSTENLSVHRPKFGRQHVFGLKYIMMGSLHLAGQVERSLSKILLRGGGRSLLKYIMSVLLSNFECFIKKKFSL